MIELGLSKIQPERRQQSYTEVLVAALQAQAASISDVAGTAAVEAAAGALSRAFAAAEVSGPAWAKRAISPEFLGQVGRELVRAGQVMHVIEVSELGRVELLPCTGWNFDGGDARPSTWRVEATTSGPSGVVTRFVPYAGVVFVKWGNHTGQSFSGRGPLGFAHLTGKLQSETERSLGDEAAGPLGQLITVPQDGGDGGDDDPLKSLKADLRAARGKAVFLETTAAGWGQGRSGAPLQDWKPQRLGPQPPAALDAIMGRSFNEVLAACGTPPGLFASNADGTNQRESYRRYFALTVEPLAAVLAGELSRKLEVEISLKFAGRFAGDLAGRARAFQSLVGGGMDAAKAAGLAGLLEPEE